MGMNNEANTPQLPTVGDAVQWTGAPYIIGIVKAVSGVATPRVWVRYVDTLTLDGGDDHMPASEFYGSWQPRER